MEMPVYHYKDHEKHGSYMVLGLFPFNNITSFLITEEAYL